MQQRANSLPLNLVDGEHDDDDDVDDSHVGCDYDEIDEDDHDMEDMEDQRKIEDRLSPDQHAKATAAAVAHISGTSEYISFAFIFFCWIFRRLFALHFSQNFTIFVVVVYLLSFDRLIQCKVC